jgi:hypothetical protein
MSSNTICLPFFAETAYETVYPHPLTAEAVDNIHKGSSKRALFRSDSRLSWTTCHSTSRGVQYVTVRSSLYARPRPLLLLNKSHLSPRKYRRRRHLPSNKILSPLMNDIVKRRTSMQRFQKAEKGRHRIRTESLEGMVMLTNDQSSEIIPPGGCRPDVFPSPTTTSDSLQRQPIATTSSSSSNSFLTNFCRNPKRAQPPPHLPRIKKSVLCRAQQAYQLNAGLACTVPKNATLQT